MTFEPEGSHPSHTLNNLHLLHGNLPHEVVCTENLTPFVKLLPCKGKAGISSLFDGHKLFDASWQTMAIDVRPVCPSDGGDCVLEMEQTVDMVLDIERSKRPRGTSNRAFTNSLKANAPQIIPYLALRQLKRFSAMGPNSITLMTRVCRWPSQRNPLGVFKMFLDGQYQVLARSQMQVTQVRLFASRLTLSARSRFGWVQSNERRNKRLLNCAALHYLVCLCQWLLHGMTLLIHHAAGAEEGASFDLFFSEQPLTPSLNLSQPRLHAFRSMTGHGQERGGIQAVLTNPLPQPVSIVYMESLPWFMKPYLHTLKVSVSDSVSQGDSRNAGSKALKETYYRPAVDRERGTHIELLLDIPASSTLTLSYDIEKAILRYTEYPPDANRGFDVAPAVIRILPSSADISPEERQKGVYLRTTDLLLPLPTPDFSMPYNVIILTSTVMALGFGSIFNLLVRRFVAADEVEGGKLLVIVAGFRERLKSRIQGLLAGRSGKGGKDQ